MQPKSIRTPFFGRHSSPSGLGAAPHHHPSKTKSIERWFYPNHFLLSILVLTIWCRAEVVQAQPVDFQRFLNQGKISMLNEDYAEAQNSFEKAEIVAREAVDFEKEDEASRYLRKLSNYIYPFLELHSDGEQLLNIGDGKAALDKFEQAKQILTDGLILQFSGLEEIDSRLMDRVDASIRRAKSFKNQRYVHALEEGKKFLELKLFNEALSYFQTARNMMSRSDMENTQINSLIDRCHSGLLAEEGDEAYAEESYEIALQRYKKAITYVPTPSLLTKIDQTTELLYTNLLLEARNSFQNEQYAASARAYKKANFYRPSTSIDREMQSCFKTLIDLGEKAYQKEEYHIASAYFGSATYFGDQEGLKNKLQFSTSKVGSEQAYELARKFLAAEELEQALLFYKKGHELLPTEESEMAINRLSQYDALYDLGIKNFFAEKIDSSIHYLQSAQALYDTKRVQNRIKTARQRYTTVYVQLSPELKSNLSWQGLPKVVLYQLSASGAPATNAYKEQLYRGENQLVFADVQPGQYKVVLENAAQNERFQPRGVNDREETRRAMSVPGKDLICGGGRMEVTLDAQ
jgi:flagellin-specific chaperone FliS